MRPVIGLAAFAALRAGIERWAPRPFVRPTHTGAAASMSEGAALAGALIALAARDKDLSALIAVGSAAALGALDDHVEDTTVRVKGLAGHLAALRRGRLTTGAAKLIGISLGAGLAALAIRRPGAGRAGRCVDVVVDAALIAGSANLVNLLDLRGGRALKGGAVLLLPAGRAAAGPLAVVAAALPADLAGRTMLGDTGANALGAAAGHLLAARLPRAARAGAALAVAGLIVASEKVSFTAVIDQTPALRAIDRLGRS